ncbi:MAG: lipoxygenase family protein [Leptolyngbyaceae cyanobacterium bins.302]|nr:lipoxygenase family protein [Leptolyngbyaceae cyanobacterium bins.302]
MAFYNPPRKQQGQYRYDPTSLDQQGPARIFPYAGDDGLLRYLFSQFGQTLLDQGRLSQPWNLFLDQVAQGRGTLDKVWYYLTTQLVDFKVFQSGWFNVDLPPDEQFDADFVQQRRSMMAGLRQAQQAAANAKSISEGRSRVYEVLNQYHQPHPVTLKIQHHENGLSDREFARQRLAGQNPMALRLVQPNDQALLNQWAGKRYSLATGDGIELTQAATEKRLFIADYPLLANLTPADLQPGRYVGSPVAIFHSSQTGLEPVLIQLEPGHCVTREPDLGAWMRAKLYVQVADLTQHELITHLGDTHLAMEAFAIATPRQLPANHPLYRLLKPHFQFLLAINTRGNEVLLGKGAAIDSLMAPTREASISLINKAYRDHPFQAYALPTNVQQRGVTAEFLPEFPYRDDALLLWQAIAHYTTNFLHRYYPDDAAVQQDLYLQAWAAELGEPLDVRPLSDFVQAPAWMPSEVTTQIGLNLDELPSYSRVPGFPTQLSSLQQLIDIATQIIFTCGPQHAAVNFSQFDYVGFPANAPLAAYCSPDVCKSVEELMPPHEKDLAQIELAFALCGIRWGSLGSSAHIKFLDPGDRAVLAQFQAELTAIEQKISVRNQERLDRFGVDYPYLLPSRIPNSINI